ncbi:glycosyltransferase family 4 protein [uncultured Jatrophihabitans sp.]|uniref:glycosyltransferase family 4 protein n=1 Tax=uncultured Jatrophihabitans sp. TaxID=1610747 RepID=UPI0035CB87FC
MVFLSWRDLAHPEGGGSELFVERIAKHLHERGWDVTICCAAHPGAPGDEVRDGVRFRRRGGRLTVYLHGLAFLLRRSGRRADVVVDVQNGLPFFSPLVRRRRPVVNLLHHVHREQWQMIYPGAGGRLGWHIESRWAPKLYRRARYVTVSAATRDDLGWLGVDASRVELVHNGIDTPHPDRLSPRSVTPRIVVLGRLVPHKQVEHALEVAARLRAAMPELVVDVIGDGWWRPTLDRLVRDLDIEDTVTFHGNITDAERDDLLGRAWVMLAPSVKEGWGIAIMEAAAHGVPALAYSSAGGVRESIVDSETGWLVTDLDELGKRTDELLRDHTLRAAMSRACREHADGFSWQSAGARFEQVLDRMLTRGTLR